jgi:hypothetical protein
MSKAKKKTMKPAANVLADSQKNAQTAAVKAANTSVKAVAAATTASVNAAESAVKSAPRLSAIDSNVSTPDAMVHAGTTAMKDFVAASAQEAQKTQEKVLSMGNEGLQNWNKASDQAVRSFNEAFAIGKEHLDAVMESSKIATDLSRDLHEKFVSECNDMFAENVELSKSMLECRTLNDVMEIQSRTVQNNLSRFFEQTARAADAWFKIATEASEPLHSQANQVTGLIKKNFAS